jgi:3-methylfumaryl-CoA hydratase
MNQPEAVGKTEVEIGQWIGRSETTDDVVSATPYAALCATLDQPVVRPAAGTPLPALWHWLYFLPLARRSDIGPDGHAKRGGFLPPVPLPRRMWAGSQFEFHEPLRMGDRIRRVSTIEDITQKSGRNGPLTFVRVRHEILREETPAITEFHDIVYREMPRPDEPPAPAQPAPRDAAFQREWTPDDVLLFRYSALTFNGHRIHYDRRYVTEVEGYPGLVVHGPLIATLLIELVREKMPGAHVKTFEFRAVRPTFDTHPFWVCGKPRGEGGVDLWAQDHAGALTMKASCELA